MLHRVHEAAAELGRHVMALQTSVGPIFSIICASGQSTTVTNGNMYSFFAAGASGESQCSTVGSRYSARPSSRLADAWRYVAVTSVTPGVCRSASIAFEIASAVPGTVNAARLASGWSVGSGRISAMRFAMRFGDLAAVPARPDSRAVDAAASAVCKHAVDHHVEVFLPAVDLIVPDQDLREARAVRLHPRVAAIPIDRRGPAEDQASRAAVEDGGADIAFTRIDRDRFARDAGLEERFGHAERRPRLLRTGLQHEADLHRNDRQPQRVHAGRVRRQHQAEHRALGLKTDRNAAFLAEAAREHVEIEARA